MPEPSCPLPKRAREACVLLCKGLPTKEVAAAMNCAPRTVEGYADALRKAYGVRNIAELIRAVYDLDAVDAAKNKAPELPGA